MSTDLKGWAARQRAPFTLFLVASLGVAALLAWLTQGRTAVPLALLPGHPWGLLTYPWAFSPLAQPLGLLFFLFFVAFLFQTGATVEGAMGTPRFAAFWAAFTLLPALVALSIRHPLAEPYLPASAVIVAWCARNQGATVGFWGIPMGTRALAGIVAAMELFSYGAASPLSGLLLVLPLGLAWAFGAGRLPIPFSAAASRKRAPETVVKGGTKYDDAYYESVRRREVEREEQERLRKLFEGK